jgi:hypothetical protein
MPPADALVPDSTFVTRVRIAVARYRNRDLPQDARRWQTLFTPRTALEQSAIHAKMTLPVENIHATPPVIREVAPILHNQMQVTANRRNITLSNGAADADGR